MKTKLLFTSALLLALIVSGHAFSRFTFDVETGAAITGYNDVRIPGDGGTLFSLSDDLKADTEFYYRLRLTYHFNPRHHLSALFAPLTINSHGRLDRDIYFVGKTFPAHTPIEATYKFNSYRLTYRYDFLRRKRIELGIGFTAKIRDAKIRLSGDGLASEKANVGFVPIIRFRLLWNFSPPFSFLLEGDALAAPQGRAEDVLAALTLQTSRRAYIKLGYRILEGGADNDEVYTFALIHYAAVGAGIRF
jgi:hypothetical protein